MTRKVDGRGGGGYLEVLIKREKVGGTKWPLNGILKGTNTDIRVQTAFISHVGTTFEVPSGGLSNTNDKIGR